MLRSPFHGVHLGTLYNLSHLPQFILTKNTRLDYFFTIRICQNYMFIAHARNFTSASFVQLQHNFRTNSGRHFITITAPLQLTSGSVMVYFICFVSDFSAYALSWQFHLLDLNYCTQFSTESPAMQPSNTFLHFSRPPLNRCHYAKISRNPLVFAFLLCIAVLLMNGLISKNKFRTRTWYIHSSHQCCQHARFSAHLV